jgi:glycine cleavage system H protein
MASPADRRYAESHEWFLLQGDVVTIGITAHAVDELTDVTYVEMRPAGTAVRAGDVIGEVESVKTTADVYSAVPGEVIEVNGAVTDDPALLNRDPFRAGWLVRLRTSDPAPLGRLMDAKAYDSKHPVS